MKHYYRIVDALTQVLLLLVAVYTIVANATWRTEYYCIAGVYFVISLAIHFTISSYKFEKAYRNYALLCIAVLASMLYGIILWYLLIAEIYLFAFLLPVVAVMYTCTCIAEIFYLNKRPISYIK